MSRTKLSIMFSAFIAVVLSGIAPAAFAEPRASSPVQNFPAHEYDLRAHCSKAGADCAPSPAQSANPPQDAHDDPDDEDLSVAAFTVPLTDVLVSSFSWGVSNPAAQ